jgi:hypothetical protein
LTPPLRQSCHRWRLQIAPYYRSSSAI